MMMLRRLIAGVMGLTICASGIGFSTVINSKAETSSLAETLYGDANEDGVVNLADSVRVLQYLANPDKYQLSEAAKKNADVNLNGNGISSQDSLSIQKYLLHLVDELPESYLEPVGTTVTTTPKITTTSKTTTSKPTTTTTTSKTTTSKSITTTTTSKTTAKLTTTTTTSKTTAKPTTTTTTSKTTTSKSTTTTTISKTTTSKPTTTTTTSKTTTSKPTTITTTSKTTVKPITTTTTSKTTTSNPTTTATTTVNSFVPPARETLINEDGEQIPNDTYDILLATAKLFNVGEYDIVYSKNLIEGAYFNPGLEFCGVQGMAYGYGVQIINPEDAYKLDVDTLSSKDRSSLDHIWQYSWYLYMRPIVAADMTEEVLNASENTYNSARTEKYIICDIDSDPDEHEETRNPFDCYNWYLVPRNIEQEINLGPYNLDTEPGATSKYYLSYDKMGNSLCERYQFERYCITAEYFEMPGFRIQYNSNMEPISYSFIANRLLVGETGAVIYDCDLAFQIVPTSDLSKVVDIDGNWQEDAPYSVIFDEEIIPYFFWLEKKYTKIEWDKAYKVAYKGVNEFYEQYGAWRDYAMIPLKEDGTDDLRPYWDFCIE